MRPGYGIPAILFTGAMACGGSVERPVVRVIIEDPSIVEWKVLANAKMVAAAILGEAGIVLKWSKNGPRGNCHERVITIAFGQRSRNAVRPDAIAYALPFQADGVQIRLLLDQLQPVLARSPHARGGPDLRGVILGHVLAHELVHVLQGFARHTDRGLMKGHWSEDEFQQMGVKPLEFMPEDILLARRTLGQCTVPGEPGVPGPSNAFPAFR